MSELLPQSTIADIAHQVSNREISAQQVCRFYLERVKTHNERLNCFTQIMQERAMNKALAIDAKIAAGLTPGPLAGVPFAVKNLFDIEGVTTLAGSKINARNEVAATDAILIQRLEQAGAILLGGLAMGEYAYDFTGENEHYGACLNPWDSSCMSGGSSSGSGSAVGAALVPLSLGSDTNGSIRVPASLCGIFGLKPTYGRLPRSGTFPFCDSLDHLGPLARSSEDLAIAFDILQGWDSNDSACARKATISTRASLNEDIQRLRIGKAEGYFSCEHFPEAAAAMEKVSSALGISKHLTLSGAEEGRSAAYLITNAESADFHHQRLQNNLPEFDCDTRERFLAGALLPASWYIRAQQVRHWWLNKMLKVFEEVDVIIAPCTPCTAPKVGTKTLLINGEEHPLRPNLGLFTQPFSAIGLPVCSIPVWHEEAAMPIGIQVVAPPWREDLCLRVASHLEKSGIAVCQLPQYCAN